MKLIPEWKKWWKRHSVQLLALLPLVQALREWLPTVREFISPELYGYLAIGISITAVVVMQVKQTSVSGPQA